MSDISVSNPGARRTKTRRTKKGKVYASKGWKEKVAAFVAGKSCEWCGSKEHLLPHHPYRDTPDAIYEDLYLSGCVVLCNTCHFMFHRRHKKKCPVCHEHWMDLDVDMCYPCHLKANPGLAEAIQVKKAIRDAEQIRMKKEKADKRKELKQKHPCKKYLASGSCKGSMIGSKCPYGIRTAKLKCGDFEEKVKK